MTSPWPAPRASRPIDAVVHLPGSKSMTNRALVIAALAEGESTVSGRLHSDDTQLMVAALRALGAHIVDVDALTCVVAAGQLRSGRHSDVAIEVGLAGTVARFTPPLAALGAGTITFDGTPRMRERPIGALVAALRELGVAVSAAPGDRLPITVRGAGAVAGGEITLDAAESSQVVSGLLLAAPSFTRGLVLHHRGGPLPSRPHVAMTVAMMRSAGAEVHAEPDSWRVPPGPYRAGPIGVEPDLSTAAPFLAAALVTGGRVRIAAWPHATTQPGDALPTLLAQMGATCTLDDEGLTVVGGDAIGGVDADLRDCSELAPVLAAVATLATGPSRLSGIGHLRHHETDRLRALADGLSRLGGDVTELDDGLRIRPAARPLVGTVVPAEGDHRLAMAYAVIGLAVDGVAVDDVSVTSKTMPDFVRRWSALVGPGAPT